MANTFEIKVEDNDGAVAGAQFNAYLTEAYALADNSWAGTNRATLGETQPVTCDPNGEATITHAAAETLYIRVVGETEVTGVRSVNDPLINTVTNKAVPVGADVIPVGDSAASFETKYVTITDLATAVSALLVAPLGVVISDNALAATDTTLTISAADASGGADGDVWIKVT